MIRKAFQVTVATLVFGLSWHIGSVVYPNRLPAPVEVIQLSIETMTLPGPNGHTGLEHLQVTFSRVMVVVFIALIVSVVVGVAMGINTTVEKPLSNLLPVWLTLPDVVVILFAMILFNFSNISVIVGISLLTIPFGIVNTWQGTKDIDPKLLEMASVFEAQSVSVWRNIYIPALLPYLFASGRYLLGMIWKLVLLAEAFGITTGIGSMVRFWYRQGDITTLLAYFVPFVIVVFAIEYLVLAPLERRTFAWRAEG